MPTVLYWYDEEPPFRTHEVRFSAITSETHEDTVTITEHPVESGSSNADHAKDVPERISIEGVISTVLSVGDADVIEVPQVERMPVLQRGPDRPSPVEVPQPPMDRSLTGIGGAALNALGIGAKPIVVRVPTYLATSSPIPIRALQRITPGSKPRDVYETLLEAKRKKALFTVSTDFREYFDMMLERVALIRTVEDGRSGRFQVDLRRVEITATETVSLPVPAHARGAVLRSKGAQATKPVEPPLRSTLHQMFF